MSILDENQRLHLGLVLAVGLAIIVWKIHGGIDVGLAAVLSPFVLYYTARVKFLHKVVGLLEVLSVTTLVAE